jgi:hypothetical protein
LFIENDNAYTTYFVENDVLFFTTESGITTYKDCIAHPEDRGSDGGCVTGNKSNIMGLQLVVRDKSSVPTPNEFKSIYPDWDLQPLGDFQGQGPGLHIGAVTIRGDKDIFFSMVTNQPTEAEYYLKQNSYPGFADLFKAILSTLRFED